MPLLREYSTDLYSVEESYEVISIADYLNDFRNVDYFLNLCRQCPNYGRSWACPPFEKDYTEILESFENIAIFLCKIAPVRKNTPLSQVGEYFIPVREKIEKMLLDLEKINDGLSFSFAGKCLYCKEECARCHGKSCVHPSLVRPSLEAVGFDMSLTAKNLFNTEILWGKDGNIPEYLTFISGFCYRGELNLDTK